MSRTSRTRSTLIGSAFALSALVGMVGARTVDLPDPAVQADVESILSRTGWRSSTWGVLAVSLDYGDTLVAVNSDEALIPASNVKLLTTMAALYFLGPDYRYSTFIMAKDSVAGGVLDGDLTFYGTGDPAVSWRFADTRTAVIEGLADSVVASGIRRIDGDIVGDASYFGSPSRHPSWDPRDLDDWFAAPASALSFNENVVTLRVVATETGQAPNIHTIPPGAEVAIVNRAVTVSGRPSSQILMSRRDGEGPILVTGEIGARTRDRWDLLSVSDPALFAAGALRDALRERGVVITGNARAVVDRAESSLTGYRTWPDSSGAAPRVVAVHRSPPLHELLAVTNKTSHNLYAELILRSLGRNVFGDGTFEGGARAVERFLQEAAAVDTTQITLVDGSGLSRENRVSASSFVQALDYMAKSELWDPLWESLPEAGGRELRRMNRSPAEDNLRAKTGTLTSVSALSGLLRTVEGERILFSIIQNGVPSRGSAKYVEDRLSVRLATFRRTSQDGTVGIRRSGVGASDPR